ncbi:MAG: glycosyltransferase family 2 protein [Candidatus Rokubacteria bacterium]|nr:glycosyltransferase family 2 protein [Candidatus Rokubacteria bacterium]
MAPVIVIPAFQPGAPLIATATGLRARLAAPLVVVDDGSGPGFVDVFRAVSTLPGVTVLAHTTNRGKGRALRTAMQHVLAVHPAAIGVVTADADGQHAVEDIAAVAGVLCARPDTLVLGSRRFGPGVPVSNRLGNTCARWALRLITGRSVSDAQTGLRAIPRGLLPALVRLRGARYDFEMEVLLWACARRVEIDEQPIRTIYAGAPSHFDPVLDSARIVRATVRFAVTSALGARRAVITS